MSSCSLDEGAAKYLRGVSSGRGQLVCCDRSLMDSGTEPCKLESAYRTRGAHRRLFGIAGPLRGTVPEYGRGMGRNTSGAHLVKVHAFAAGPSSKKVFCRLVVVWILLIPLTDAPRVAEASLLDQETTDVAGLSSNPPDDHIYTWIGNTPEWNRKMHVAGYRMGCDAGD